MNKISNWKTFCFRLKHHLWNKEMIRTKELKRNGDCSFMEDRCVLIGVTRDGNITMYQKTRYGGRNFFELRKEYNDGFWCSTRILNHSEPQWNKFIGKSIRTLPNTVSDRSYENNETFDYPILVSASKHHLVLNWNNKEKILDYRWANPNIWEIVT